jgi:large subunit ribosomal protein L21
MFMYAVIRAGGKQYRVAPGDVVKIEKTASTEQRINFEVLAVSATEGQLSPPEGARVVGTVLSEGRRDKILVFHFKRKKQYKKLNGHRQGFTEVRIAEIFCDGQKFLAPELPAKKAKAAAPAKPEPKAASGKVAAKPVKTARKSAARKPTAKKSTVKKSTK